MFETFIPRQTKWSRIRAEQNCCVQCGEPAEYNGKEHRYYTLCSQDRIKQNARMVNRRKEFADKLKHGNSKIQPRA